MLAAEGSVCWEARSGAGIAEKVTEAGVPWSEAAGKTPLEAWPVNRARQVAGQSQLTGVEVGRGKKSQSQGSRFGCPQPTCHQEGLCSPPSDPISWGAGQADRPSLTWPLGGDAFG